MGNNKIWQNISSDSLQDAIKIANFLFYGYHITINDQHIPASPSSVRQGVKYISLSEDSRKIWDDPDMLPAHKYQNIPQIDISTYMKDYCTDGGSQCGPINLGHNSVIVSYQYSANRESHNIRLDLDKDADLIDRFFEITRINRIIQMITEHGSSIRIESELSLLIFREDSVTDMIVDGKPFYLAKISHLADAFSQNPTANIYVPYRQGWSKLLNIVLFQKHMDHEEYVIVDDGVKSTHLLDISAISTWDGISTKIENHGIEVEDMRTRSIDSFDTFEHKMRKLVGTHEQMRNITIEPVENTTMKHYVVYTIKGINVDDLEFDMP